MFLKTLRIIVAFLFFSTITLFFLDYAELLPRALHVLAAAQIVPALLGGGLGAIAFWVLLTFLFGRVYCSAICPLGVLQDVISWTKKRFRKKAKYSFRPAKNVLKHVILAVCVLTFVLGFPMVLGLLDPYSIYGRMMGSLLRPIYLAGNNAIASICNAFGYYGLYLVPIVVSFATVLLSLGMLLLLGILAARFGRYYCNTICPVGTVLGWIARHSRWKIRLDEQCFSCGLCEARCKGECIDSKNKTVDSSRCIGCFNCLDVCKRKFVYFDYKKRTLDRDGSTPPTPSDRSSPDRPSEASGPHRRTFLGFLIACLFSGLGAVAPPKIIGKGMTPYKKNHPILPPGAKAVGHFQKKCTACHLCVSKCPANILTPAVSEYGLNGFLQPTVTFKHGFCNYDCTICSEVCPNHALMPLEKAEKHLLQIGRVNFIQANCVVESQHTNCGACAEHCPTGAVTMIPFGEPAVALTIPQIDPDLCVGCGACEFICPVAPHKAIYVDGLVRHQAAKPAFDPTEKQKEVKLDGFGF